MRYSGHVVASIVALFAAAVVSTTQGCVEARPVSAGFVDDDLTIRDDGGLPVLRSEASVGCEKLQCQRVQCADGATTTVSGVVYDPAGTTPLYNAVVYIPNAALEPIKHGVTCDTCGTMASGDPVATALTGTDGRFKLENVPVGTDVPVIIQIGKWRRRLWLPTVEACRDNPITDKELTRLPRNRREGDMPLIALSTGCDPMECLFRKMGIDDAEFTGGDGDGHVHLYKGVGGGGTATSTSAYELWPDAEKLRKYDIVINACECSPFPRGEDAYPAMHDYLDSGGRFFGSHFQYNWFTDKPGAYQDVADWTPNGSCNDGPNIIDDSFPKGKAFADWLMSVGASTEYGHIPLSCAPKDLASTKKNLSQRWIYDGPSGSPSYVSFNTPVDAPAAAQCGRAVFADVHVSRPEVLGDLPGKLFPTGCSSTTLSPQEKALEFMLFDLSSCIRSDSDAPKAPAPK